MYVNPFDYGAMITLYNPSILNERIIPAGVNHKDDHIQDPQWFENFKNKDGTYSLYDNDRFGDNNPFHEKWLSVNVNANGIHLDDFSIGYDAEVDIITGGWEWTLCNDKYLGVDVFDVGHAELGLSFSLESGFNASCLASIYSPGISFSIFGITISLNAEIGAVGGKFKIGNDSFELGGAMGYGISISFSR